MSSWSKRRRKRRRKLWKKLKSLIPERPSETRGLPVSFASAWVYSRNKRDLLLGLPALAMACLVIAGAVLASSPKSLESGKDFIERSAAARESGNAALAHLYLRRAAQLTDLSPEARYREALRLSQSGRSPEAEAIMKTIAPADRQGFRPAHQWLVDKIQDDLQISLQIETPNEAELQNRQSLTRLLRSHSRRLLEFDPAHVDAKAKLAE